MKKFTGTLLALFFFSILSAQNTSYSVSPIAYNPDPFTSGTQLNLPVDDAYSPVQNIPFGFCFYDSVFHQKMIGSTGILTISFSYSNSLSFWAMGELVRIEKGSEQAGRQPSAKWANLWSIMNKTAV